MKDLLKLEDYFLIRKFKLQSYVKMIKKGSLYRRQVCDTVQPFFKPKQLHNLGIF